jgi:hypothetical protein
MGEEEKLIGDSCFSVDCQGARAVIIFPALGTPALLHPNAPLTIIIAAQGSLFDIYASSGSCDLFFFTKIT